MEEIWKDIPSYEGIYQASSFGNVRSLDRYVFHFSSKNNKRLVKGKILSKNKDNKGYPTVYFSIEGKGTHKKVHRLVCKAFHKRKHGENIVNHIDGNKENNHVSNLEWSTYKMNVQHAIDTGLWKNIGENATDNVLTEKEVLEIRGNSDDSYDVLAEIYGVSKSTIADIKKFRSWKWLGGEELIDVTNVDREEFCKELARIRNNSGLTIEEFGNTIGVSRSTVTRWERGTIFPKNGFLKKLIELYDLRLTT